MSHPYKSSPQKTTHHVVAVGVFFGLIIFVSVFPFLLFPRSSPLRPFPRVLLCLLSIPKVTIVHGVGCSLNLNISYYCSSVSWEYRQRLVEHGQAIDPQNLPLSGHPLAVTKSPNFWAGNPPPPPRISRTNFNIRCHLT